MKTAIGKRILIIGDSQVVVGALSKGRSSRTSLNHVVRRSAGIRIAMGLRVSIRYIRTHRNHADAPSRGLPFGVKGVPDLAQEFYATCG